MNRSSTSRRSRSFSVSHSSPHAKRIAVVLLAMAAHGRASAASVAPLAAPLPGPVAAPMQAGSIIPLPSNAFTDGAFAFIPDTPGGSTMTVHLEQAFTGAWATTSGLRVSDNLAVGVYDPNVWAVVFKFTSITVPAGKTVLFTNHSSHAPVVWLSDGAVSISGTVNVSGTQITCALSGSQQYWLEPGPGGFRGGINNLVLPRRSAGFGPGGGFDPVDTPGSGSQLVGGAGGRGNYASTAFSNPATVAQDGAGYGSPVLFPLIGGSGAGSTTEGGAFADGAGGGPGGGALLIATNAGLQLQGSGSLRANGGADSGVNSAAWNVQGGSGGGIRLVCNTFSQVAGFQCQALGNVNGCYQISDGGAGRIRVEANTFLSQPLSNPIASLGTPSQLLPDATTPRCSVIAVRQGAQTDAVPADPRAGTNGPAVDLSVPYSGAAIADVEAFHVAAGRPVTVRVTSFYGDAVLYTGTLVQDPQDATRTTAAVSITLPTGMSAIQARVVL